MSKNKPLSAAKRAWFSREIIASNGVGPQSLVRNAYGQIINEISFVDGETNSLDRAFDVYGRLIVNNGSSYAYDTAGYLASISNAIAVTKYRYAEDRTDAGYSITFPNGTIFRRSLTRDTYRRSLVTNIVNSVADMPIETLAYAYDALNRPVSRSADIFGYNERGEVVLSCRDAENAEESYSYDHIGNLLTSSVNAATNTYTSNNRNQYTSILRASVSPRETSYDLDENLTRHGEWTYAYDSGNRLVSVALDDSVVATFAYDAQGRRVKKVAADGTHRYFYDGWLLVYEHVVHPNNTTNEIEYVWGKDISGTRDGAAGIGGLLYLKLDGEIYVPRYDAYGNILGYRDAQGSVVAQYAYDAFGNTIAQFESKSDAFSLRFSTKYFDVKTGLYYYGYRYYHPSLMRWLTEDPIGVDGGINLYAFCENGSPFLIDATGLTKYWDKYMNFVDYRLSSDVWKQVGGNLYWGYISGTYYNSCALRVSRTLILNGHRPKKGEHRNVNKDYVTLKEIVSPDGVVIPKGTKLKAEKQWGTLCY